MEIFVEGEGVSLIGTGSDELCSGRQAIAAIFSCNFNEATAERFEWGWKDVAIHCDAATVAVTLVIHLTIDGEAMKVPLRWTVSLVRVGEDWKWVHRHASSAANSQDDGTAYPTGGKQIKIVLYTELKRKVCPHAPRRPLKNAGTRFQT